MDTAGPSDSVVIPFANEGSAILTVEEDFESLYDVPFVTVNRIEGQIEAEVIFSGVHDTDMDRIMTALQVGQEHGQRAYARVFGIYGNVLIHFSDHPDKGKIWGLLDTIGDEWLN